MSLVKKDAVDETALARPSSPEWDAIERVVVGGDLSALNPEQRVLFVKAVCETHRLDWRTAPFIYVDLGKGIKLYATMDCAAQLRRRDKLSLEVVRRESTEDLHMVEVRATAADGRVDTAVGVVSILNYRGDAKANAFMRAETKAKRRVTLSICGLGMEDDDAVQPATVVSSTTAAPPPGSRTADRLVAESRQVEASASVAVRVARPDPKPAAAPVVEAKPTKAETKVEAAKPEAVEASSDAQNAVAPQEKAEFSREAMDDEIEVLADEYCALVKALGEKETTVKAVKAAAIRRFGDDLVKVAELIRARVDEKRAKVASLSDSL